MIDRLMRLVSIRSVSRDEAAMAAAVGAELENAGLSVERRGFNTWTELGDAPRPRLLLNSHLDTVPPGDGWTADPWMPRRADGRITGLGANDAKGCVAAMMQAALSIKASLDGGEKLGGTVVLALTAEEEITGQGLGTIVKTLRPIDAALVGEPTGLVPMTAQRGLLIIRATARGRSAHPANTPPDTRDNAIMTAAADVLKLREFDWGPTHPLLGRCHAHATMISGGVARNVIPDKCEFFIDIRTTPSETHEQLVARLSDALRSELDIHSDRLVSVETNVEERIVQAALRAIPGVRPAGSRAMSDMVFLSDVPAVKIGPGDSNRSHTPDEYITEDELRAGAATYERIIREYFKDQHKPLRP